MNVTLILIDAQDASGGAVPVRLASHDIPEACHLGGEEWEPALARLPDFALDFFGGAFSGQVIAPRTGFSVATIGLAAFGGVAATRARFADARVRIWTGDITSPATVDLGPLTLRFDGRITGEPDIDDASRIASFDAAVQDSWADKPLLPLFAGTGGIEGPADLTGQPKPLVLGNARFCGGVLIDNVDNVWMVSHGPVQAVNAVYDRLASLGASAGNFADLAALKAATIPNGSWGTCLALGLVRLAAPPDGRVSFDVSGSNSGTGGYVRLPGAIIRRIADIAGGTVNAASLSALDTARPYNLQLQLREQVTAREIIASLADSVGAVAGVSLRGELFAQALTLGASGPALNPDDSSELRVAAVEELAKAAPSWRLATQAELTFEVHSADEAAFSYRWQGEYAAARVYRRDDVVAGPDSAAWAYINAVPAAGQALPVWPITSNSHWRLFQAPGGAGVSINGNGQIVGIGTGSGTPVDNGDVMLEGAINARPGGGNFVGQLYSATDTREVFRWDGTNWIGAADITATAQRSIEPQFPVIEIRQGEAGHTGNRTVTHVAKRGTATLTGGTWSLPSENLGTGDATINSSTGTVTLSGIVQSGAYGVRYTHTDGIPTDLAVNVTYVPTPAGGVVSAKVGRQTSSAGTSNVNTWQNILTLTMTGCPAGRVRFSGIEGLSFLEPQGGTGTADFEARLQLDGVTLTPLASQAVVSGGVLVFSDFSELFNGSFPVTAGTRVFAIDLRRTSGGGTITSTSTALEATIIAS